MVYASVPLPTWHNAAAPSDAAEHVVASITEWVRSAALADLVEAFGGRIPRDVGVAEQLAALDDFSADHWDFRRGRERNLAATGEFAPGVERQILESATALGLVEAVPPMRDSYDVALILGGLVRACYVRPRFAAWLASRGVEIDSVVALGGFRPLGGDEHELASALAIDADNEFGSMIAGVRAAFGFDGAPEIVRSGDTSGNSDWAVAHFVGSPPVDVVAAPSREPETRRANTADTYEWWAQRTYVHGKSILVITSTIYVPYQGSDAIRMLGMAHGADVETVGVPPDIADLGRWTQEFTPANYLQEIRSSIRGFTALLAATASMSSR